MTEDRPAAATAVIDAAIAVAVAGTPSSARLLAIGWSTVDAERAELDLAAPFDDAPADAWLGARCRVARDAFAVPLVLLEPVTEGRLAGALARHGEGPVAAWYEVAEPAARAGERSSPGPFGPEWPIGRDRPDGAFRFLVGTPPGTMPA